MTYVKWTLRVLLVLIVGGFLHYTLPQHDIVRIVGANTQRMDLGATSWFFASPDIGTETPADGSRDVKFIQTMQQNGRPMVFRNEDTGWGWPPYFKVNSFDVQTEASDLNSTEAAPKWVLVTHYGWRNQFFTVFPNAVGLRQVDDPSMTVIPWFNIFFFLGVAGLILFLRRVWMQFRERTVDPLLVDAAETWDAVDDRADAARDKARGVWARFTAWLGTWRSKSRG